MMHLGVFIRLFILNNCNIGYIIGYIAFCGFLTVIFLPNIVLFNIISEAPKRATSRPKIASTGRQQAAFGREKGTPLPGPLRSPGSSTERPSLMGVFGPPKGRFAAHISTYRGHNSIFSMQYFYFRFIILIMGLCLVGAFISFILYVKIYIK